VLGLAFAWWVTGIFWKESNQRAMFFLFAMLGIVYLAWQVWDDWMDRQW
jgi:hypothetical protein